MEKINIAELLKDCPTGMELDCVMYDDVTLFKVDLDRTFPITLKRTNGYILVTTEHGQYETRTDSKCIIFPKGKTTWEGFVPPCKFKDGDIVVNQIGKPFILKSYDLLKNKVSSYCGIDCWGYFELSSEDWTNAHDVRYATEEEKQRLFDVIKAKGYRWDSKTKTLEKLIEPKFRVGDKIRHKTDNKNYIYEINKVYDDSYGFVGLTHKLPIERQKYYELVLDKFDINTLIPFESKVLIRSNTDSLWRPGIFGFYKKDDSAPYFIVGATYWPCCIPYENNEHLLGTTNDCDEFYKTWKQ